MGGFEAVNEPSNFTKKLIERGSRRETGWPRFIFLCLGSIVKRLESCLNSCFLCCFAIVINCGCTEVINYCCFPDLVCRDIFKFDSHYFKRPEHSTEEKPKHSINLNVVPDYGAYNLMDPILYEAVKKDDSRAFKDRLQSLTQIFLDLTSPSGNSLLHKEVKEDDIGECRNTLTEKGILDRTSPSGNSLLHEAASFGSKNIAKDIIDHHPSLLTRRNIIGDTALHVAAKRGKLDILEVLTVNSGKQTSGNPLEGPSLAYEYNDDMQLLRMQNQVGNTALHEAVIAGGLAEVEYLLSKNSETAYYLNKEGVSPFCLAAETGNKDILRRLLELVDGNDKLIGRPRRESPIYAVILQRSLDMLEEIAKTKQVLFHIRDEKGKTPLYFAASKGYLEGVQFLLHYSRQSTLERSTKGDFPIHAACKNGHVNVVNVLLEEQWPDPTELLNKEGQNILHVAAKSGKDVVVKNILRNPKLEKLLNAKDNDGNTAVHLASMNLHPKVVVSLTWDKRIDLKLTNMAGLTALDVLADCGSIPPTTLTERYTVWALFSASTPLTRIGKRILRRRRIPPNQNRIKDMVNLLSLVTILVATVTFAAGLTVPGGINSSESSDHKKDLGMATLVHRGMFQVFIVCDSIGMYCSIIGTFILMWAQLGDYHVAYTAFRCALYFLGIALFATSLAFMAAVYVVVSKVNWLATLGLVMGITFIAFLSTNYIMLIFPMGWPHPVHHCISHYTILVTLYFMGSNVEAPVDHKKKDSQPAKKDEQFEGSVTGPDSV